MAIEPVEEPSPYDGEHLKPVKSNPVKRLRWATHRASPTQGRKKRQSIMERFHKRSPSDATATSDGVNSETQQAETEGSVSGENGGQGARTIYFNVALPGEARDEEGHPLAHFPRNKIRTAKYTPLSFFPKNLWFQFHQVANIYFLFIIILTASSPIFGGTNPGLSSVPLIVILIITALKDAIEDFRRTILDNELNNSPVHRLVGFNNVNTAEDNISLWRKFKKANTRGLVWIWSKIKSRKSKKSDGPIKAYAERATGERPSLDTRRTSMFSDRLSLQITRSHQDAEYVEMTPVPSPYGSPEKRPHNDLNGANGHAAPPVNPFEEEEVHEQRTLRVPGSANRPSQLPPKRFYGTIINNTKESLGEAKFKKDFWKNVQVGDFVRLYNEEQVPADIVVLATSDPDGACYVETKNLDGETNLKVRQALHCGRKVKRARDCEQSQFLIESEAPHANLYNYSAVARWNQRDRRDPDAPTVPMAEPISINNLLLRGCSVRNTEWVLGVVVFTGADTKIMLNSGITPSKRAKISRDLNWNVIYNFIILFFMCVIAGIVEGVYFGESNTSVTYFEFGSYGGSGAVNGLITYWAAIILFQNLVPISLYISLEIIRTFQAFFIYSDAEMYYDKVDYPCTPKSWNISDDLGQIEYIFSDKTGTLTQNVMEFKKATINGVPYGEAYTEAQAGMQKRQGINIEEEGAKAREQIAQDRKKMLQSLRQIHDNPYLRDDELTFVAPDFVADLQGESGEEQSQANEQFMLALALCHTVITERTPGNPPRIEFKAQSPDEAALVATARDCGFTVIGRSNDGIIINVMGEDITYTVLNTLEFNSTRKRMSAIMRMPDGKIILYCKGADSIIYSRLRKGQQHELRQTTAEHLEMFAREGLRTLCIAQRELSEEEYQEWSQEHDIAAASVQDRDEKLEKVSDAIERNLTLLGGTAIEDRLQIGVPDAIALLANAGIKLWVLTGDKVETAINIGFSCNLLNNDMDLIVFKIENESLALAEAELDKHLRTFNLTGSDEELAAAKKNHEPPAPTHAIVIDGDSLKLVLDDSLKQKFLLLCKQCKSVLCCRVSPSQKAAVVRLVKNGLDVITLSIGDGANDVAMIQEADVGVGIAGEEGRQAVMSSDFAIGQFRFLVRLTLVHGRWCYRRMAETIANFFYKNIVWTFSLFWYNIYANYDCSYVFDYTYILLYNLAFTSLPIILLGILDQDVSDKVSLAVPQLYRRGIERLEWTQVKFWTYMFDGLYQSLICFFMVYLLYAPATFIGESGRDLNDNRQMGVYIANAAVVVVNSYVLMNLYRWDWIVILVTAISTLLIFAWTGIWTSFTASFQFYKAAAECYGSLTFWASTFLIVIICLLPRFASKAFQKTFLPRDIDIVREEVRQGKFRYLDDVKPDGVLAKTPSSLTSSDGAPSQQKVSQLEEDERPFYPPSTVRTSTLPEIHSAQGSDETRFSAYSLPRVSGERTLPSNEPTRPSYEPGRPSYERGRPSYERARPSQEKVRPSFDRMRSSLDPMRASFEQSRDFTSASNLMRVESGAEGRHRQMSNVYEEPDLDRRGWR